MAEKIGQMVAGGITKMQGAKMVPTIKPVKTISAPKATSNIIGGGWFQQKVRHSNARRFGKAGEPYTSNKKKINVKKLTWEELQHTGINPQGDADEDGIINEKDCKPLDPKKDLSLQDIKKGLGKVAKGVKGAAIRAGHAAAEGGKIALDVVGRTKKALQSLNPKAVQKQIDQHKASKDKIREVIGRLEGERDYLLNKGADKDADKIMNQIKNLQSSIDRIEGHEKKLEEHKEKLEAIGEKITKGVRTTGKVVTAIAKEEQKLLAEDEEPSLELKPEPTHDREWKPEVAKDLEFFTDEDEEQPPRTAPEYPAPKPQPETAGTTELEQGIAKYYDQDPSDQSKGIFSFSEDLAKTESEGNAFARFINQEKKMRGEI